MFLSLLSASRADAQSVTIPRVSRAPRLADFADAELPAAGQEMVAIEGLIQRTPVDGAPVSEPTMVYLGYDARRLYALFVCVTGDGIVRAHRVNRDRLPDDDDSVALHLDTFHDRRRLYGFQVNPQGVQVDGIYTEGAGWDLSFDAAWSAETIVQANRYLVLITIPFSSVRFSAALEQNWGFFVYRGIPRRNEEAFWPAYSQRFKGRLAYAADLRGLRDLDAGHATQVFPYGTFRSARITRTDSTRAVVSDELSEWRGGVDVKTVLNDALVLDLTANPDFSQVESDEPQTTVNKRFEVFFPEKRPFFIENASYFETPIPALFTRRIRDPRLGARLSGKVGKWALGALVSDDVREAPVDGVADDPDARAFDAVFRISRDVGRESQFGVLYTGRRESPRQNHVGGVDGRLKLNENWITTVQALTSSDEASGGPSRTGTALYASVDGQSRRYTYQLTFKDITPDFAARLGFIPRADIREVSQVSAFTFRPAAHNVISWGPSLTLGRTWDHSGSRLDDNIRFQTSIELPRATNVSGFHSIHRELLRLDDVPLLATATRFDQRSAGVAVRSAPLASVGFSGEYSVGTAVNLTPASGLRPTLSGSHGAALTVAIRPRPALTVDTTYLWTTLSERGAGPTIFSDHIVRSRWNYQLTRRLSLRAIARHETLARDPALTTLQDRRDFNFDLLATYFVQPGRALYVGWNSDRQNRTARRSTQLFVKGAYGVRF